MAAAKTEERGPSKTTTATALKGRAVHKDVTLPSGAIVDIRIPNLPEMVASKTIPNDLIDSAIEHQETEKVTREILQQTWDFTEFIVPKTLVTPEIKPEDVKELSTLDLEMLANFAARRTDIDAVGHQLGGLETQESFRNHRGIVDFDAIVGSLGEGGESVPETN